MVAVGLPLFADDDVKDLPEHRGFGEVIDIDDMVGEASVQTVALGEDDRDFRDGITAGQRRAIARALRAKAMLQRRGGSAKVEEDRGMRVRGGTRAVGWGISIAMGGVAGVGGVVGVARIKEERLGAGGRRCSAAEGEDARGRGELTLERGDLGLAEPGFAELLPGLADGGAAEDVAGDVVEIDERKREPRREHRTERGLARAAKAEQDDARAHLHAGS